MIEGDQKLYEVLQELKCEYGNDLDWVIPMPGDWHLYEFSKVIMKLYLDAGLKELAKAAGYLTASIQVCGQFKRTHQFLLEVWEALYRFMIDTFLKQQSSDPLTLITQNLSANPDSLCQASVETQEVVQNNFHKFKLSFRN